MKVLHTEINISASPEQVWQNLTDFSNYGAWNPFIHHVEGKAAVGEEVKIFVKVGSRELTLNCTILELAPNQKLRWKWHIFFDRFYSGEHSVILKPQGHSRVHIDHREIFNGLLLPFFRRQIDTQTKQGFVDMDKALKARCEEAASEQAA